MTLAKENGTFDEGVRDGARMFITENVECAGGIWGRVVRISEDRVTAINSWDEGRMGHQDLQASRFLHT